MSDKLQLTLREGASGKLAIINGKTYSLLRLYQDQRLDGIFCLIVAGRTSLKADDLAEHWCVVRGAQTYMAFDCRPFSYHLIQGEGSTTDAPRWPRLKTPANFYTFIGPTEDAVQAQIRLTLDRYGSQADPEYVLAGAFRVPDVCGGPPAYLVRSDRI